MAKFDQVSHLDILLARALLASRICQRQVSRFNLYNESMDVLVFEIIDNLNRGCWSSNSHYKKLKKGPNQYKMN